jgi:beta-galactosidase
MTRSLFYPLSIASLLLLNAHATTLSFNADWKFVRLTPETNTAAPIKNQGSDWASQYDVTHTATTGDLVVSPAVLKTEFQQLGSANWESVALPHTPHIEPLTVLHQWQGICYYKKNFTLPETPNKPIRLLEFEGAMHLADVWINGQHVTQHAGGYTPFVIDTTTLFKPGQSNEILVRLDNRNNPLIPPGKPLEKLDFCYYGGLYRNVNLILKNKIHLTHPILTNQVAGGGVFVTYEKETPAEAIIHIQSQIKNETAAKTPIQIRQHLVQIDGLFGNRKTGKEVATATTTLSLNPNEAQTAQQTITLAQPRLWSPDAPHLYLLRTEILHNNQVVDSEERRIGIRRIQFSRENGFEINGQKLRLVGSNRHMEYPYVGNALPANAQYRDIFHIKESGFNTVRLGHYPQDKSVLDACDELGILAIEPIPGWQFFNKNEQFIQRTYRDIQQMIRRDRNHPSIILWETILNESWPPADWKDQAAKVAHAEYPGDQCFTAGDSYGYFGWDVQYNDWEEGFNRPNNSGKPGFIREYYDYEFGGHNSSTRIKRGDGEAALLQNAWNAQWSHNRYRAYYPWTVGDAVWSMYDYNRGCCDNICRSGVADLFRLPKFSLAFFKSQMLIGQPLPSGKFKPYLFLATHWTAPTKENKVIVYANVEEVALLLNGKEIARKTCDSGADSPYAKKKEQWYSGGNPFDGGNVAHLTQPPFTFTTIPWQSGTLEAVGSIQGKVVARTHVSTPEKPSCLEITYFESGKPAATNDLLIVYVNLLDSKGTRCVKDSSKTTLTIQAGGKIISPKTIQAEAGIASFLVKTADTPKLTLTATTPFAQKTWTQNLTQK